MRRSGRPSQRDGLREYAIPQQGIQAAFSHDLYLPAERLSEVKSETGWEPGGGFGSGVHQEIDVAIRSVLSAGDRAEDSHVARAVASSDRIDLGPLPSELFSRCHVLIAAGAED